MLAELLAGLLLSVPISVLGIFSFTELWQRKEYRWDRFRSWLFSSEAQHMWSLLIAASVLAAIVAWLFFSLGYTSVASFLGWVSLIFADGHYVIQVTARGVLRPKPTLKAISIFFTTSILAVSSVVTMLHLSVRVPMVFATLIVLLPLFTSLSVAAINVPFYWRKRQLIRNAASLRQKRSRIQVVGITGSYGKTSTKYFLEQLLQASLPTRRLLCTKDRRNSEIGVAIDMLEQLTSPADIYLVEMAAYRRGEIKALAELTRPQIGVLTAIGNQHLALFGSQLNILEAKWELIQALLPQGTAVLNADDSLLRERARAWQGKILWFSLRQPADVYVDHISLQPRSIDCRLHIGGISQVVTIPLASDGLLSCVVAAVAAAYVVGADAAALFANISSLCPFSRTMEIITGRDGATVIDDSYSANEQGVLNALRHLRRFSEKDKRVVLFPLIELGQEGAAAHARIGAALNHSSATIYLTSSSYPKELAAGHVISRPEELVQHVTDNLSRDSVVLLEGRVPELVRKALR